MLAEVDPLARVKMGYCQNPTFGCGRRSRPRGRVLRQPVQWPAIHLAPATAASVLWPARRHHRAGARARAPRAFQASGAASRARVVDECGPLLAATDEPWLRS